MKTKEFPRDREVFRTRFSVILMIALFLPFALLLNKFIQNPSTNILIPTIILGLSILLLAGIRYMIAGDKLIFRMWFIPCGEISINSIERIERTYIPLSSNAGSLKRLGCKLKKGSKDPLLLISPKNETRFLARLKEINPNIEVNVCNKKGFFRFWDWDI